MEAPRVPQFVSGFAPYLCSSVEPNCLALAPTNALLGRQAVRSGLQGQTIHRHGGACRNTLNPRFVEWLMLGYSNIGWTDLERLETPLSHFKQHSRSRNSQVGFSDVNMKISSKRKSPPPPPPHFAINVPSEVNFWMRLFPESATYTLPELSTAIPSRLLNCPSPFPESPHCVTKFPLEVNF